LKINDNVKTPDGDGVIIGIDLPECNKSAQRFIVKLDNVKYDFTPCYWLSEIKFLDRLTVIEV